MHRYLITMLFLFVMSQPAWAQKDFTLTLTPPTQTLNAGRQTTYTLTSQPINGFKKLISLTVTVSPSTPDVTAAVSSSVISPGGSATVTVNTSALADPQTVTILITGTGKRKVRTAQASLTINVPQFSLGINPLTATVVQGDPVSFTIVSQGEQDFARNISLNVTTVPPIPFQLSKQTLSPPSDTAMLQFASGSIAVGSYVVTITGTAGQLQRTLTVTFTVTPRPVLGNPKLQVIDSSINLRADEVGHLVVTGLAQNVGDGDAIFVRVNFQVFNRNNQVLETGSTFINGFPGITSTGLFIDTTLPRGRTASFQKTFEVTFVSDSQRVEFSFDFQADIVRPPLANLVVLSLDRTLNALGASDYSLRVRNIGRVGARAPQIVIDSFNRANQIFNVTLAGSGAQTDVLQAGQERVFTASDSLPFDDTRVNESHAIWFDSTSFAITQPLTGMRGLELEKKRNQIIEMQRMAHNLLLMR